MTRPIPPATKRRAPSPAEVKRLEARERAHRKRAVDKGVPMRPVSIEGLLLLQDGICQHTGKPLIFDPEHPDREAGKPVIAHERCLAMKHTPGHVPGNVWLWHNDANRKEARVETKMLGRGRRVSGETCRPKGAIPSPGFQSPPAGHKWKWPKRKVGQ